MLGDEVGEEEASLRPREMPLVQGDAIRFGGDPTREKDLQLALLTRL
jgi:hypothetical protein